MTEIWVIKGQANAIYIYIYFGILYSTFQQKHRRFIFKRKEVCKEPISDVATLHVTVKRFVMKDQPVVKRNVNKDKSVIFKQITVVLNQFEINIQIKLDGQLFHLDLQANDHLN